MIIATKHDLEAYLADKSTQAAALVHLQCLMDERYNYDLAWTWGIVEPNGLTRLGLTAAEAVELGAEDRAITEPAGPDLAQFKDAACTRLNARRDAIQYGTFTDSHGHPYDVDSKSREKMTGLEAKIANGLSLPEGFSWTGADNAERTHTNASFLALTTEILFWTQAVHVACVDVKKVIRAVTAEQGVAVIESIESSVVWP